jgi:hypothetical protein
VAQRVRQIVAIGAPVEEVFDFLDVPENSLALIPQLVEVREVTPLPNSSGDPFSHASSSSGRQRKRRVRGMRRCGIELVRVSSCMVAF